MPYECFVPKRFIGRNGELIEQANSIIAEYQDQGFVLTLRQLYYQFVARALIPNTMQSVQAPWAGDQRRPPCRPCRLGRAGGSHQERPAGCHVGQSGRHPARRCIRVPNYAVG